MVIFILPCVWLFSYYPVYGYPHVMWCMVILILACVWLSSYCPVYGYPHVMWCMVILILPCVWLSSYYLVYSYPHIALCMVILILLCALLFSYCPVHGYPHFMWFMVIPMLYIWLSPTLYIWISPCYMYGYPQVTLSMVMYIAYDAICRYRHVEQLGTFQQIPYVRHKFLTKIKFCTMMDGGYNGISEWEPLGCTFAMAIHETMVESFRLSANYDINVCCSWVTYIL